MTLSHAFNKTRYCVSVYVSCQSWKDIQLRSSLVKMKQPTFDLRGSYSNKTTADIQKVKLESAYDWKKSLNLFLRMQCAPVTTMLSHLKAILHMSPISNQSVCALLGHTESRGSCPHQAMQKENFINSVAETRLFQFHAYHYCLQGERASADCFIYAE